MPRANSNNSRSTSTSTNGRGRRREQPIQVDQPFIDVEAIDDDEDVVVLSPSQTRALASNVSRRRHFVYLDDDDDVVEEVNPRQSGVAVEEDVRIVSGNSHNKRVRISSSADGSADKNNRQTKRRTRNKVIDIQAELPQPIPVEVPLPPPKEPTFSCPVCLSQLSEPCSTTCGHVFCQSCIKTAIQAQKKCPTCRKKLTNKGFHRLYLPNTAN
ncbi:hypothetical protein LUZ61_005269 [Rhynchospora tenuis]|uniref:RING-type domain-containing protein n=1 Tax=Rhynchospora tenuis TaxID=198213 RepID=A0AAD5ZPM2_9POAL|nr:hypothetical protein LUZ61_005269 [Rhynchospora tenuis]